MNGPMKKMGFEWLDNPPALKRAKMLLEIGGAIGVAEEE
jgi:hypothetical protein